MGRPGGPSTSPMPRGSADVQRLNSLPPMSPSGGFPCWSALAHRVPLSFLGSFSCQISEDLDSGKLCVDAQQAGAGSWLKYIRVACSCDDQNLTMCQINEQVGPDSHRALSLGPWYRGGQEWGRQGEGLAAPLPSPFCSGGAT